MQVEMNLSNIVESAESINVYNDGNIISFTEKEKTFDVLVEGWQDLLDNSHEMPAFGVSLNRHTTEEMKKGLWIEFVFEKQIFYNEMPFEKLLVKVEKLWQGFNIIRYNASGGYDGRCYYVDLVGKNMSVFYDILINL